MSKTMRLCLLFMAGLLAGSAFSTDTSIDQKDRRFSQTDVTLRPGDTITFRNSDEVAHNVFSATPGHEFEITRQAPGEKSTIAFPKEGVVEVRCSIHPRMKLIVTVKK
jgi:plastocyanin